MMSGAENPSSFVISFIHKDENILNLRRDGEITLLESEVLAVINNFTKNGEGWYGTLEQLSKEIGVDVRSVKRAKKQLITLGYVIKSKTSKKKTTLKSKWINSKSDKMSLNGEILPNEKVTECHPEGDRMSLSKVTECHPEGDRMSPSTLNKKKPKENLKRKKSVAPPHTSHSFNLSLDEDGNLPSAKTDEQIWAEECSRKFEEGLKEIHHYWRSKSADTKNKWNADWLLLLKEVMNNRSRVEKVMDWYLTKEAKQLVDQCHCAEAYCPNSFREKFLRIEKSMNATNVKEGRINPQDLAPRPIFKSNGKVLDSTENYRNGNS